MYTQIRIRFVVNKFTFKQLLSRISASTRLDAALLQNRQKRQVPVMVGVNVWRPVNDIFLEKAANFHRI